MNSTAASIRMPTRRPRRAPGRRSLLPVRADESSNSLSCWYCDWKFHALNEILYSFGRRYTRQLEIWFTLGAAFGLFALFGVTMLLIWELAGAFRIHGHTYDLNHLLMRWLLGASPLDSGLNMWVVNAGIMFFSTSISVAIHEFGHAVAAASVGIQIEYMAIFLAVIFPGALVALNNDVLKSFTRLDSLRIYCAGIWHNAALCAVCGITLLLLPWSLHPLYVHVEMPMVLKVTQNSALYGYISPGDMIAAVDGSMIHHPSEWIQKMIQISFQTRHKEGYENKGYCVPDSWLVGTNNTPVRNDNSCPDELTTFISLSSLNSSFVSGSSSDVANENRKETIQCLNALDVVKLRRCGDGGETTNRNSCGCYKEELCMMPVHIPGMSWVEISYLTPYSSECLQLRRNLSRYTGSSNDSSAACGGTFILIGYALSLAYSISLSSYQPRQGYLSASIPILMERILYCTFHVSATLGALNSLPVYFLDGESILETILYYFTWLDPRRRCKVLRLCLVGGSIISIVVLGKILYAMFALFFGYRG